MTVGVVQVEDLEVTFLAENPVRAVRGISLQLDRGEAVGIVGESGSGKSVSAMSLIGLLPASAQISGRCEVTNVNVIDADPETLRRMRGARVGFVFQDPLAALDPLFRVGSQLVEAYRSHIRCNRREAREHLTEVLASVGIPAPSKVMQMYPHELSGGMRQRIVIAAALACGPELIIADEPTTALDVTVQAQILDLLASLRREREMALILVTHDLGVAAQAVDRILVMYAGRVVESGNSKKLLTSPAHPYTLGLLESVPSMTHTRSTELVAIPGEPVSATKQIVGCSFAPRCTFAIEPCFDELPILAPVAGSDSAHSAACWRADEIAAGNEHR